MQGFSKKMTFGCATLCASAAFAMPAISPVHGQEMLSPYQRGAQSSAGITVVGHSDLKVKPDIANVIFTVTTQAPVETDTVRANATKMQSVMQALAKSSVASRDIRTSSYQVSPTYDYNVSPAVLTGYSVTNSIDVILRDIPKAGLILDKAIAAGATSSDGLSFDLADKSKVQGEALVAAVADARSKADLVAGASGVMLGRVIAVTEAGATPPSPQPLFRMNAVAAVAPSTPVAPQEIEITADVTATYAIDYAGH